MSKKGVYFILALVLLTAMPVLAQTGGAAQPASTGVKWGIIGAAFTMGVAAAAGAFAQGKATAAACEGMARNPGAGAGIRLMAILGLAFIESLVIYALVIAFTIKGA
jgi:F-type H+-transporting ATPase subunit c